MIPFLFAGFLVAALVVAWVAFRDGSAPDAFDQVPADVAEVWAEAEWLTRSAA